ncbi:MAG: lipase [Leptolyngbya sp. SIO4C1]|nr:lipase [Leptolyngbya sp. SIO4C1]
MKDTRICFVGDSFVNGTGDPTYLGWVGRVCQPWPQLTVYNLGVRRETSLDIKQRWQQETERRWGQGCDRRLVFSFGANDMTLESGRCRVDLEASIACARQILIQAQRQAAIAVLMIGPPPVADDPDHAQRIVALCDRYAQLCRKLKVAYLPTARALLQSPIWRQEASQGDGAHPAAGGYAALAQLVLDWPHWQLWLQGSERAAP